MATMGVRTSVLASALGLVASGCGQAGEAASGWQAVVDTVGDTVVVRTTAGSVWGDTTRLVEELRIGSMEGTDAYVLGNPVALAVADGRVFVLDAQVPVVRSYDAGTSEYLGDLGREGGGPGEYGSPDGLAVLPDGRVLVRDPRTVRISVYRPDGTFLEAWPHPNGGGFHTYETFYVDTTGTAYITTLQEWGVPPWEWELALIGIDARGEITDTIPAPGFDYEPSYVTASRENSSSRRQVPFTPEARWSFSPDGYMVAGVTGRYAIYVYDHPVIRIERDSEAIPVIPEEGEERRRRITVGLQRQYGGWRWNGPPVPDTKPPWRDLFVDADRRVWVVVSRPGAATMTRAEAEAEYQRTGRPVVRFEAPPAFDVFDRRGRFLGPVAPPTTLVFEDPRPIVSGDTMWAVVRDELGVPAVVRFRMTRGEAPGD